MCCGQLGGCRAALETLFASADFQAFLAAWATCLRQDERNEVVGNRRSPWQAAVSRNVRPCVLRRRSRKFRKSSVVPFFSLTVLLVNVAVQVELKQVRMSIHLDERVGHCE